MQLLAFRCHGLCPRTGRAHPSICGCLLDKGHGSERRASGPGCQSFGRSCVPSRSVLLPVGLRHARRELRMDCHRGISLSIDARS